MHEGPGRKNCAVKEGGGGGCICDALKNCSTGAELKKGCSPADCIEATETWEH